MQKSEYCSPRIVDYGSLSSLTLGSGNLGFDFKVFRFPKN